MAIKWFVKTGGHITGPFSSKQLKDLANKRDLEPETGVSKSKDGPWVPAKKVKGLFDAVATSAERTEYGNHHQLDDLRTVSGSSSQPRVFISHSSKDRVFVETELAPFLKTNGISTWYSRDEIQTSERWQNEIRVGLDSCDWFLIVLSPRAAQSEWVKDELHWAIDERPNNIIPVMFERCNPRDFHIRLGRIQYVDFSIDKESAKRELLDAWKSDSEERNSDKNIRTRRRFIGWKVGIPTIVVVSIAAILFAALRPFNTSSKIPQSDPPSNIERDNSSDIGQTKESEVLLEFDTTQNKPFDLLALVDPLEDTVLGRWLMRDGRLVHPAMTGDTQRLIDKDKRDRLQLPYEPPSEYDLLIEMTPETTSGHINIGLVIWGKRPSIILNCGTAHGNGIANMVDENNNSLNLSETGVAITNESLLRIGKQNLVLCKVREKGLEVLVNNKSVIKYAGDQNLIVSHEGFQVPNSRALSLGTFGATFHINKIEVTPLSSGGKLLRSPRG